MKKIVTIFLLIFGIAVAVILLAGLFGRQKNKSLFAPTADRQSVTAAAASEPTNKTINTLTITEVAKHNSAADCWLVIAAKVYDVTNFINSHPGGPETIIPYCGQEATPAFNTKGNSGQPHSPQAQNLLGDFYLGNLVK